MAKEFYVDRNGDEIQISGTVTSADMLPIKAGSSKMTSEAIGDLSYHSGDTISESTEVVLAGHTSGAGTNVICYLPLAKPISSDVTSVTMQISGAVVYNNSGSTNLTNGTYTATTTKDGLRFSLPISSSLTGSIAVTVAITTRTITFT